MDMHIPPNAPFAPGKTPLVSPLLRAAVRPLLALAVAALAITAPASRAAVPLETADALVRESGLAAQLADAQRAFVATIDQHDAASLPSDLRAALKRAGTSALDPEKMRVAVTKRLAAELDPAHAQAALEWWRSPEGRRIAAIDVAASKRIAADARLAVAEGNAAFEAATPLRQALLQALERATTSGDLMADGQIRSVSAMMDALSTIMARGEAEKTQAARRQLESQRPQLAESMRGVATVLSALSYTTVDDATLANQVAFVLSPAGRGVLDATSRAFLGVWVEAVGELTRSFPRITGRTTR